MLVDEAACAAVAPHPANSTPSSGALGAMAASLAYRPSGSPNCPGGAALGGFGGSRSVKQPTRNDDILASRAISAHVSALGERKRRAERRPRPRAVA